jgi:hypothetical protein
MAMLAAPGDDGVMRRPRLDAGEAYLIAHAAIIA